MKIETLICFLVGSLIFIPGSSTNPDLPELKFTDYTVENGLSYNSVLSICQDTTGTIWFATNDGLNRFNGHDIYIYRHRHGDPTSLPGNSLQKIMMDEDHQLWACTSNGLARYDPICETFRKADIPAGNERYYIGTKGAGLFILDGENCIFKDKSGGMWIGTEFAGVKYWSKTRDKFNSYTIPERKPAWYRSTAARIIFAILVLGALAALTRWFLKHTETVKAKEIAQITKTYEEKVQKTKLEMFVDSSYNLKLHEETFLSSVLACIEKNIGNQDFTVEALASHACITRGNLHRKLKNLTGKTPVELIKTMRMKRACELMKETDLSIADIAERTGFQTPGYFITVFKNHFGETPGHYASRVRQQ